MTVFRRGKKIVFSGDFFSLCLATKLLGLWAAFILFIFTARAQASDDFGPLCEPISYESSLVARCIGAANENKPYQIDWVPPEQWLNIDISFNLMNTVAFSHNQSTCCGVYRLQQIQIEQGALAAKVKAEVAAAAPTLEKDSFTIKSKEQAEGLLEKKKEVLTQLRDLDRQNIKQLETLAKEEPAFLPQYKQAMEQLGVAEDRLSRSIQDMSRPKADLQRVAAVSEQNKSQVASAMPFGGLPASSGQSNFTSKEEEAAKPMEPAQALAGGGGTLSLAPSAEAFSAPALAPALASSDQAEDLGIAGEVLAEGSSDMVRAALKEQLTARLEDIAEQKQLTGEALLKKTLREAKDGGGIQDKQSLAEWLGGAGRRADVGATKKDEFDFKSLLNGLSGEGRQVAGFLGSFGEIPPEAARSMGILPTDSLELFQRVKEKIFTLVY